MTPAPEQRIQRQADVIQLRPKRPRDDGGARQVRWQCPDCPCGFNLAFGYTGIASKFPGRTETWRLELTCPHCGVWMAMENITREGGHAKP